MLHDSLLVADPSGEAPSSVRGYPPSRAKTGYREVMREKRERAADAPAADSLAPHYPIESVDNALKLLLLLGEQPQIRLSEATRYLGVASSTAHRLLAMLTYR